MPILLVIERRDLGIGRPGVVAAIGSDVSDVGGDGGVGVSETTDEADFVRGVATVGEDVVVVGEFSEAGDRDGNPAGSRGVGFRRRCRSAATSA